jgi:hypothetical protein
MTTVDLCLRTALQRLDAAGRLLKIVDTTRPFREGGYERRAQYMAVDLNKLCTLYHVGVLRLSTRE